MKIKVELEGRDKIEAECDDAGVLKRVSMVGCSEFMDLIAGMRKHFGNDISKWPLPDGVDHSSLLLKELILKLRGEWVSPYIGQEVCHCRAVSTSKIEQAILSGAHTTEKVSRATSASTACGTCRPDVQKIIDYRLKGSKPH